MPKSLTLQRRVRAVAAAASTLCSRREVLLAVVFGGILEDRPIRDLDIAVLLHPDVDRLLVVEELRDELERATGLLVDLVDLSEAPPRLASEVLEKGAVLVERVPGLAARLGLRLREDAERLSHR